MDTAPLTSADLVMRFTYARESDASVRRVEAWANRERPRILLLRRTQANAERAIFPAVYLAPAYGDNARGPSGWWNDNLQRGTKLSDNPADWWR